MTPLDALAVFTALFVGTHLLMSHPWRAGLVARLGEKGFLGVYSLVSFVTLGGMVWGWRAIEDSQPLWIAPLWWLNAASWILLLASILLIGSLRSNPAFPKPGAASAAIGPARGVFAITRHPMNVSFILWALIHLSIWGSPRNLIVAGGILILALAGSIGQDRKKERLLGDAWRDWEARTSFLPFAALASGRARLRDCWPGAVALLGGLAFWLAVTYWHAPLFSPIGWLRPDL
ncbi:NnrU family protein [Allosphingosinicella indica]|uniref:Uncharacterized membrane protein n=1 Tax=Allosphingosinicella indica TaxID=941907 RepID=A0A1X7GIN0_9SPHN|nr:NnrU family protein [Allosphingosinicella indica]SMF70406.1 Uncharacterized membrane protein [Allosphingosinicella indica]